AAEGRSCWLLVPRAGPVDLVRGRERAGEAPGAVIDVDQRRRLFRGHREDVAPPAVLDEPVPDGALPLKRFSSSREDHDVEVAADLVQPFDRAVYGIIGDDVVG